MHVLLIHQAFCGPDDPGGTRHFELGRRFVAAGNRLTVVTAKYNYLTGRRKQASTADGIDVRLAPTFSGLHRGYLWRVAVFLSFAASSTIVGLGVADVDVVLGTSPPIFQAFSSWLVAAIRRKRFVLEVRDLWPEFAIQLSVLRNRLLIAVARGLERFLYRQASHIVVNSPAYREYLLTKQIPESKISIIPNGADPSAFHPEGRGENFRNAHGLIGKFVVMYAGAVGLANDIDSLMRAAEQLRNEPDLVFAIVGSGKELQRLRAEAKSLNLENIQFIPALPKGHIAEALSAADLCVATLKNIPMFQTTYPNKVFDYMAAERPIVLAIDGVIREVLEKADAGLFVRPGDAQAIADAVRKLRDSLPLRQRMGANGRTYVERHFNRNVQAEQFANALQRVYGGY